MQQPSSKIVQDEVWLGGKVDSLGIVQKIEFWLYNQMVNAQTRNRPRKFFGILRYKTDQPTPARRPNLGLIKKKGEFASW